MIDRTKGSRRAASAASPGTRLPPCHDLGQAAVVVHAAKRDPAGMTLAHDIGLACLPLSIERIEFLLEALVGRFSGVDRAADDGPGSGEISLRHRPLSRLSENPAAA